MQVVGGVGEEQWDLVDKAYQVDSIDRALNVIVKDSGGRMN